MKDVTLYPANEQAMAALGQWALQNYEGIMTLDTLHLNIRFPQISDVDYAKIERHIAEASYDVRIEQNEAELYKVLTDSQSDKEIEVLKEELNKVRENSNYYSKNWVEASKENDRIKEQISAIKTLLGLIA